MGMNAQTVAGQFKKGESLMECTLCHRTDITKMSNGSLKIYSPDHRGKKEIEAMICGNCTAYLIQDKRVTIPWDGELRRPQVDPNKPLVLRRRKGA